MQGSRPQPKQSGLEPPKRLPKRKDYSFTNEASLSNGAGGPYPAPSITSQVPDGGRPPLAFFCNGGDFCCGQLLVASCTCPWYAPSKNRGGCGRPHLC